MPNIFKTDNKGYVFIDILVGLLIFGLGFATVLSLNNWAVQAKNQADNYLEAINIASSTMDEILHGFKNKDLTGDFKDIQNLTDRYGRFERVITMNWDAPNILIISVKLKWIENGEPREYLLESLLYVKE
ncbi:MAG: hypothetical protein GX351_03575 [Peptococcaceae bacterium]|nr:hypothetical protein [Peptococcaceae bacterium]